MDSFFACGFPQEFLVTVEENLIVRQENLIVIEEFLIFQTPQSSVTRMDRGFQACGYLLQRYLQRFYKEIYKFAHTRERTYPHAHAHAQAQAHTRENQKTNWSTVLVSDSTASGLPGPAELKRPPRGGNISRFARPPRGGKRPSKPR